MLKTSLTLVCGLYAAFVSGQVPIPLANQLNATTSTYFNGHSTKGLSAHVYYKNNFADLDMCRGVSHSTVNVVPDMFFSIGSTSKIISSCALLKLQELGQLSLNDTIGKYLPGLSPNIKGSITIRQLLQHRSGLNDYMEADAIDSMRSDYNRFWTPQQLIPFIGPTTNQPGAAWEYCNSNYLLAGMLIEQITGQSFLTSVRSLVLSPAGLDSMTLMGFESAKGVMAHAWDHALLTNINGDISGIPLTSPGCFSWSAGGFVGRSKDLAKLYKSVFLDQTVLNAASLAELKTTTNTGYSGANAKYGLGVFVYNSSTLNCVRHGGSWTHLSAVAFDLDFGNVAAVTINETEGLSTTVDYAGLTLQLLKNMRVFGSASLDESTLKRPVMSYLGNNAYQFDECLKTLTVYDMIGKELVTKTNTSLIDLSEHAPGIYILKTPQGVFKLFVN
jgi:D-alanyl-D-alanine carboxypeptidase